MLGWEKSAAEVESTQVMEIEGEEEGEGKTSLVGTETSPAPHPICVKLVETIRSLIRVPAGDEIRPIEVMNDGKCLRLFTPEDVTRLVVDYEESMTRLAA